MEISFENRVISTYREISHQTKRIQETAESVVPDTNDDIGKIASVQTAVFMKSKDVTGRGVLVTGELTASLIYITEGEKSVSYVRVSKSFSLEYDIADADANALAQVSLSIQNSEARILNPRKVSVTFELVGEMSCYRQEDVIAETQLPDTAPEGLHAKSENVELVTANGVMEKTFAINEQFVFPGGKPKPAQLVTQNVDFAVNDAQLIGTKLIVKGTVAITVCYLSNEVNYPVRAEFSTPFSQIIDTGEDKMDHCRVMIELTSCYCDIADTINGEKALDAEIHAVLQVVCHCKENICYISDVYSNLMPAEFDVQTKQLCTASAVQTAKMSADERVNVVEDCADVLSVFSSVSQIAMLPDKMSAAVTLDIIYRTTGGTLSAVRRLISVENQSGAAQARLTGARLADAYLRPDGAFIDAHMSVEVSYQLTSAVDIRRVESVTLDDAAPYDVGQFPAVTLVRVENESLWELAKTYHSSIECIKASNVLEDAPPEKLLLIPKSV